MTNVKGLNTELVGIFKELVSHTKERDDKLNDRMDTLAKASIKSSEELASLTKIVARSEERYSNQQKGLERIGSELQETNKKVDIYISNNDDRSMDIEKQNIELKIQGDTVKNKISVLIKFILGLLSAVTSAGLVAWLVTK